MLGYRVHPVVPAAAAGDGVADVVGQEYNCDHVHNDNTSEEDNG